MVLDGLERRIREAFPKARTMSQRNRVYLVRYADDFIVTGDSQELLREKVRPLVEEFLLERGLELSKEKTRITHIDEGFNFLGQTVRRYRGKFLTKPSKDSVTRFLSKVRGIVRANRSAKPGSLIVMLNPIIRGWANYHRHAASKRTFATVDHAIFCALLRWARQRHPNKGGRWVVDKYFERRELQKWVFCGEVQGFAGRARPVTLIRASDTPIARHVMVREEANPYDPKWENYFAARHKRGRMSLPSPIVCRRAVRRCTARR
jgi:RNA-directed DNA polymerase